MTVCIRARARVGGTWLFERCSLKCTAATALKLCVDTTVEARFSSIGGFDEGAVCADAIQVKDRAQASLNDTVLAYAGPTRRAVRLYGLGWIVLYNCTVSLHMYTSTPRHTHTQIHDHVQIHAEMHTKTTNVMMVVTIDVACGAQMRDSGFALTIDDFSYARIDNCLIQGEKHCVATDLLQEVLPL